MRSVSGNPKAVPPRAAARVLGWPASLVCGVVRKVTPAACSLFGCAPESDLCVSLCAFLELISFSHTPEHPKSLSPLQFLTTSSHITPDRRSTLMIKKQDAPPHLSRIERRRRRAGCRQGSGILIRWGGPHLCDVSHPASARRRVPRTPPQARALDLGIPVVDLRLSMLLPLTRRALALLLLTELNGMRPLGPREAVKGRLEQLRVGRCREDVLRQLRLELTICA